MSKPKYIDADKVIDYANQEVSSPFFSIEREGAEDVVTYKNKWAFVKQVMVGMPAADVQEVRHGRWKPFDLTWGRSVYACTSCGEAMEVPTECGKPMYEFCPYCGAKMDEVEE